MAGVGTVLQEKYRLLRRVGKGGMGTVYEAEHVLIDKRVAVKLLHPERAGDADLVERFHREAVAASRIGHVNIVEVTDMGVTDEGLPYIVMEYLEGRSLGELLQNGAILPVPRAADILGQTLAGLGAAHDKGIVHRDLKPENIFLTCPAGRADFVKILDFGISKFRYGSGELRLTRTGVTLGTPHYMAPEQAAGSSDVDHRVDIYAAGAVLYEMLAGRTPYRAANYNALLARILSSDPPPLAELRPDLDPAIGLVVGKALSREPADRFGSAGAMLEALLPFGASRTPFERPGPPRSSGVDLHDAYLPTVKSPSIPAPAGPSRPPEGAGDERPAGHTTFRVPALPEPRASSRPPEEAGAGRPCDETPSAAPTRRASEPPRRRWLLVAAAVTLAAAGILIGRFALVADGGARSAASPAPSTRPAPAAVPEPAGVVPRPAAVVPGPAATPPSSAGATRVPEPPAAGAPIGTLPPALPVPQADAASPGARAAPSAPSAAPQPPPDWSRGPHRLPRTGADAGPAATFGTGDAATAGGGEPGDAGTAGRGEPGDAGGLLPGRFGTSVRTSYGN